MSYEAVVFDFYGTLARATRWVSIPEVLADHGANVPDDAVRRYFEGHDGVEHSEHSASREDYVAWQRTRILAMLAETDVHPGEYDRIIEGLRHGTATRILERYAEVVAVLDDLRARGCALAICSNWDWDLTEAVDESGLTGRFDVIVSSAWVGARKPHPRIFAETLSQLATDPSTTLFVGDTWGPDVVGPSAAGMQPVYLERHGHWPDPGVPADPTERAARAMRITDLRGVPPLLEVAVR
ncbi:MAG TPA: HAD family hydrolase [Acidimicrobiia bacterium]|nr:HAD family hydrolase [Acidimicrobiia bacterium]